jgi:O-antigen/teichoic acid export membrane protein
VRSSLVKPRLGLLGGSGSAVIAARVVSLGCAALQLPILTRTLSTEGYGLVALVMVLSTYFALVTAEPATLAFQRHPASSSERRNYSYALGRVVPALVLIAALAFAASALVGGPAAILAVAAWGSGLAIARLTATAWLMWGRNWAYAGNLMASTLIRTLALVGLVFLGVDGLVAVSVAGAASVLASLALSPRFAFRGAFIGQSPWPRRLGYLLAAASLGVTVLTSANLVVLQSWVGPAAAASFAAMSQLATLTCASIIGLVLTALYPKVRRDWDAGGRAAVRARIRSTQYLLVAVGATCVAAFTAFDGSAVSLAVSPDLANVRILVLLSTAACVAGLGQASGWLLQLELRARSLALRTALAACASVACLLLLLQTSLAADVAAAFATVVGFLSYYAMTNGRRSLTEPAVPLLVLTMCTGASITALVPMVLVSLAAGVFALGCAYLALASSRRTE